MRRSLINISRARFIQLPSMNQNMSGISTNNNYFISPKKMNFINFNEMHSIESCSEANSFLCNLLKGQNVFIVGCKMKHEYFRQIIALIWYGTQFEL